MREALVNGLSDLDAVRPRKAKQPKGGKPDPAGKTKAVSARFKRLRSRVTLVVASAGFSAIMVGIVCNAVIFQKGHHPAPLFASNAAIDAPVPAPHPVPRVEVAPPVVPAPAVVQAAPVVAPPVPAPMPAVPVATPAAHRTAQAPAAVHHTAAAKPDGIAHLLGQGKGEAKTASVKTASVKTASAKAPAAKTVVAKVRPGQVKSVAAKVPARTEPVTAAREGGPLDQIAKKIKEALSPGAKPRTAFGTAEN